MTKEIVLILNNIRSSENVGSILRSADAFCVQKVYLVGLTPAPVDRFGRDNNKVLKASLGAEKMVLWEKVPELKKLLVSLKKEGFSLVAVEQTKDSLHYQELPNQKKSKLALVFGEEVNGLSDNDLKYCDFSIEIPMKGQHARERASDYSGKESLNVAVAVGIILSQYSNN